MIITLALFMVLIGCTPVQRGTVTRDNAGQPDYLPSDNADMTDAQTDEEDGFAGNLLAGSATPYYDFNQADYENALAEGKTVFLYFYANWCPICRAEEKETFAAFNELDAKNVVGFRVNYKDTDTDMDEEALAKQFGITYQHTKVILKNGERVLKAPDSWDKQRYLDEISKVA